MRLRSSSRPGYAMLLVLAFVLLFLAILGIAFRQIGAALRIESTRVQQVERDEGSVHALARGLALLETGLPPTSPYVGAVTIVTSTGPHSYTVTFTSEGGTNWLVAAVPTPPGETPPALPVTFAPSP